MIFHESNVTYHVTLPPRASAALASAHCPADWRSLCRPPAASTRRTHTGSVDDPGRSCESPGAGQPRPVH